MITVLEIEQPTLESHSIQEIFREIVWSFFFPPQDSIDTSISETFQLSSIKP